jgi:hypothetical protein
MKILRLLLLVTLVAPVLPGRAAETVPVVTTPATAAEIAYWKQLQAELAEFRAANAAYAARVFTQFKVAQLNEIGSRTEKFLDARDADAVDGLGADLQEYRKQLSAMLNATLTPLRLYAQALGFGAGSANFNPQQAMMLGARAYSEFEAVNGYKYELYKLHQSINKRVVAGGGPRILFFRTLNLGDSSDFEYAKSTPAQRDEKFVAASRAIHPSLGVTAEKRFLKYRQDGRGADAIMLKRDEFITQVLGINKQMANMSEAKLDAEEKNVPADAPADTLAMFEFAFALERLRRTDSIAHSVLLENWKAVFAQWLGRADESSAPDGCNDVAISRKEGWFAFTADGKNVEGRSIDTGEIVFTVTSEFPIKGLVFGSNSSLYAFTTAGIFEMKPPAGSAPATFHAVNKVAYPALVGAFAAAADRQRFAYAWGGALAIGSEGNEHLFKANSSSVITAVDIDDAGRHIVVAYSGQDNTGAKDIRFGIDVLDLPESKQELADKSVESRSFNSAFAVPVTAAAVSEGAEYVAITTGHETFGTVELFHFVDRLKPAITQLALDNQSYNFVAIVGTGDQAAVVAGTRNGMIRVWSAKTGDLIARYLVPSGPQGIALAVEGETLISANLGAPGTYRWSAVDGKLLATLDGDAPKIDTARLAAELKAEQERRPVIAKYLVMRDVKDPQAKAAAASKLLETDGPALEASGLVDFVKSTISQAYEAELITLMEAEKYPELYKRAKEFAAQNIKTQAVYYYLLLGARRTNAPDADKLFAEAQELFPESNDISFQRHTYLKDKYSRADNVEAALKEIDQLNELRPDGAPRNAMRQGVLFDAADRAYNAGNQQRALDMYVKSLDYCPTKEDQLNVLPSIFPLAYALKNWYMCTRVASAILEMDPAKKNDKQFMDAARYAYQMYQQQGGK